MWRFALIGFEEQEHLYCDPWNTTRYVIQWSLHSVADGDLRQFYSYFHLPPQTSSLLPYLCRSSRAPNTSWWICSISSLVSEPYSSIETARTLLASFWYTRSGTASIAHSSGRRNLELSQVSREASRAELLILSVVVQPAVGLRSRKVSVRAIGDVWRISSALW